MELNFFAQHTSSSSKQVYHSEGQYEASGGLRITAVYMWGSQSISAPMINTFTTPERHRLRIVPSVMNPSEGLTLCNISWFLRQYRFQTILTYDFLG